MYRRRKKKTKTIIYCSKYLNDLPLMKYVAGVTHQRMPMLWSFEPGGKITTLSGRCHSKGHYT